MPPNTSRSASANAPREDLSLLRGDLAAELLDHERQEEKSAQALSLQIHAIKHERSK